MMKIRYLAVLLVVTAQSALLCAQTPMADPPLVPNVPNMNTPPIELNTVPEAGWRIDSGAAVLFLTPRFESNPAYTVTLMGTPGVGGVTSRIHRVTEFSYKNNTASEIWLAGTSLESGIGGRVRWWYLDHQAKPKSAVNAPIPAGSPTAASIFSGMSPLLMIGPTTNLTAVNTFQQQGTPGRPINLVFNNDIRFNVWDFDVTFSDLNVGAWNLQAFGGLCYGQVLQSYSAFADGPAPMIQYLTTNQEFEGFGPTAGLEARRPLANSGLAVRGGGRLSFLVGQDTHTTSGLGLGLAPPFTPTISDDASERQRILPTFDIDFGVDWTQSLRTAQLVFDLGVLARGWPLGSGAMGNGNMGVVGFRLGVRAIY